MSGTSMVGIITAVPRQRMKCWKPSTIAPPAPYKKHTDSVPEIHNTARGTNCTSLTPGWIGVYAVLHSYQLVHGRVAHLLWLHVSHLHGSLFPCFAQDDERETASGFIP